MFAFSNQSNFFQLGKLMMIYLGPSIGELLSVDFPTVSKFLQEFESLPKSYDSPLSLSILLSNHDFIFGGARGVKGEKLSKCFL